MGEEKSFEGFCQDFSKNLAALDARLLAARQAGDKRELVTLYANAAERVADIDAECFYLTHADIFALDVGDPRSEGLKARLVSQGREE